MTAEVAGATRTIAGWTLASRLLGLVRDLITARIFGDTAIASAFMAAFVVPNVFRRLFGEGALSAAFLPIYSKALYSGEPHRADRVASAVFATLAIVTGALLIIGEIVLMALLYLLPESGERTLSLRLMALTLPFMPAVCASAVLGGVLHAHGKFVPTAAAPMILNFLLILAALPQLLLPEPYKPTGEQTAYLMGAAAVFAGAVQLLWAVRALRGKLVWTREIKEAREDTKDVMRRFGPVALGMGTLQLNTMLDTFIAMVPVWIGPVIFGLTYPLDEASNGILGFTQRLYQFPLGVFGIAVATAAFPMLSRAAASEDSALFVRTLRDALKLSLFIGLPASVGLVIVRGDITASLFGGPGSAFSLEGIDRSSAVLLGYAPAVWIYSLNHVLTRALYAKGDTAGPTRAALIAMAFNMVANLVLIWSLREAGLAWATAASALLQMLLLLRLVRKMLGNDTIMDVTMLRSMVRTTLLSLAMAIAVIGSMWVTNTFVLTEDTWSATIWKLVVSVGMGGTTYTLLALALKTPELRMLLRRRVSTSDVLPS